MAFKTLVNPPINAGGMFPGLNKTHPQETYLVGGVLDIARDFDVVLFSAEETLTKNGMTHPAGAVLVPALRRMERKLAVFSADDAVSREELTSKINYLGLSFAPDRILLKDDFCHLKAKFPLASPDRILMVCSDVVSEVALGQAYGLKTLLISPKDANECDKFGIDPDYIAICV